MHEAHARLLGAAADRLSQTSFALFRSTMDGRGGFVGTQIARLYLSLIEAKLARALSRVPWLKNPVQGYVVGDARYRGLEYYLSIVAKHAHLLQPRALGLTHGDLHAANVMLDRACTEVKLIDLDKLSWTGDYLADLGNLLTDVCVYRRVAQPMREFGLPREDLHFISRSSEPGTAENTVRYPALGRPATLLLQERVLAAVAAFAEELGDTSWKPRLWLAAAAALCVRLSFQTEKEPAAVLYGEAVRLLHELCRSLEQAQDLPALLVPQAWSQPAGARTGGAAAELPDWIAASPALSKIHGGLRDLGLHPEPDRATVAYHREPRGDSPVAKLIEPRREGIGRLLLPGADLAVHATDGVKIVRSGPGGEPLGTILIIGETANPAEVLRIARACVDLRARARVR